MYSAHPNSRAYVPGLGLSLSTPLVARPLVSVARLPTPMPTGLRPAPVPLAIARPAAPRPLVLPAPAPAPVRPAVAPPSSLAGTPWGSTVGMVKTPWGSFNPAPKPPASPPKVSVALKPESVTGTGTARTVTLDPSQVAAASAASKSYLTAQASTGTRAFSLGLDPQGIRNLTDWQQGYAPIATAMVPHTPPDPGYHWEARGTSGAFVQVKNKGVLGTIGGVLKVVAPIAAVAIPGLGILGGAALAAGGSAAGGALEGQKFNLIKTLIAGGVGAGGQALGIGRAIFGGGSGIVGAPTEAIAGVGPGGVVTTIPSIGTAAGTGAGALGTLVSTPITISSGAGLSAISGPLATIAPKLPAATALLGGAGTVAGTASGVAEIAAKAKAATGALTGVLGKVFTPTVPGSDATGMPAIPAMQAGGVSVGGVPSPLATAGMFGGDLTPWLLVGGAVLLAVILMGPKKARK